MHTCMNNKMYRTEIPEYVVHKDLHGNPKTGRKPRATNLQYKQRYKEEQ